MEEEKKSVEQSEKSSEQPQSEKPKSGQPLSKEELKKHLAVDYNMLVGRMRAAGLGDSRELIYAIDRLEESFLWLGNAIDKFEAKEKK